VRLLIQTLELAMLDGPFRSKRFAERAQSVEGVLLVLSSIAVVVYLGIVAYELVLAGAILKIFLVASAGLVLLSFAAWSSSPLAVVPLLLFAFLLGLWR